MGDVEIIAPISIIAIAAVLGALFYGLWSVKNHHKAHNSRKNRRRKSDRINLNAHQKKLHKQAALEFSRGNLKSSAKILESLGMIREAVDVYEKGKFVHEAARLLLRINRPNRAGLIYKKHRYWKEATDCFKKAKMSREVAICAQNSGDSATAAVFFLDCGETLSAADCFAELGKHREAAKLYIDANNKAQALQQYIYQLDKTKSYEHITYTKAEIGIILEYLCQTGCDFRFVDVPSIQPHLIAAIVGLIKEKNLDQASQVLSRCPPETSLSLLRKSDFNDEEMDLVGSIFSSIQQFDLAGMVYERQGKYEDAAVAFKKNEDFQRAAHCFERADLTEQALEMKIKFAEVGPKSKPSYSENKATPFDTESSKVANPYSLEDSEGEAPDEASTDTSSVQKQSLDHGSTQGMHHKAYWKAFTLSPLIADLDDKEKTELHKLGHLVTFEDRSIIFVDNQVPSKGVYFTISGQVYASTDNRTSTLWGKTLLPDALFTSAISNRVFFTSGEVTLFHISDASLKKFMTENPTCAQKISTAFAKIKALESTTHENQSDNLAAS